MSSPYAPVDELMDRLERIRVMLAAAWQVRGVLARGAVVEKPAFPDLGRSDSPDEERRARLHGTSSFHELAGGRAIERFVRENVEPALVPWPADVAAALAQVDAHVALRLAGRPSRFARLCEVIGADDVAADLVLAAVAPGVRRGFREAMQLLGREVAPGVRLAAELVELVAGGAERFARARAAVADHAPLIARGVLVVDGSHPHAAPLWRPLTASRVTRAWLMDEPSPLPQLDDAPLRRAVDPAVAAAIAAAGPRVLVVGAAGAGKTRAAAALAHARGARAVAMPADPAAARPAALDAALRGALLFVDAGDRALTDEALDAIDAAGADAWVCASARPGAPAIAALLRRGFTRVEVGRAGAAAQVDAWDQALGGRVARAALEDLVRGHALELGQIEEAASRAAAHVGLAAAATGERPAAAWLAAAERAARETTSQRLTEIADRLSTSLSWADLVLPDEVRGQIDELWRAAAARRTVFEDWGFGHKTPYGRAISALFAGDAGTGKTMVATLVARELGLELYRVDLSRMVDKYVGETEKHLARLFDEAERGRCVILFDEADALFGKRTQKGESATERYANLEVNYLLQRIETFSGICILTTNQEAAIDDAFKRRLRYRVEFPFPEEDERAEMWRRMIPAEAPRAGDVDVRVLAARFEISGGHIKNAILRAAFAAAADGARLDQARLVRAATQEMEHIGKVVRH